MANWISSGTRVFIPLRGGAVFGTLLKYASDGYGMGSGVSAYRSGGFKGYVMEDGEEHPEGFTPRCIVKDTPKNRAKYGIKEATQNEQTR